MPCAEPLIAGAAEVRDYPTFDGQRLAYRYWPAASRSRATLVHLHGMESHSGWFLQTALLLAEQGIEVYALDRRGSGQNWLGRGHCRAYEHLLMDLHVFLREVAPDAPVHLLGLSWGAKVALMFARLYPGRCASLILLTPGIWPLVTLRPEHQWRVAVRWALNRHTRIPIPLNPDLFSDVPVVRHAIAADPQRLTAATPALFWESRRLDRRIQAETSCPVPVYAVLSKHDRIIDTPRTAQWVDSLTAPHTLTTILDAGHALQLECPARLAAELEHWITHPAS